MKNLKNRKMLLLLAIVAAMAVAVGGTIAYLVDQTESLVNTFTPANVGVDIEDNVTDNVKSNVVIKNTGSTDAYIRARIVGNWVDANGTVVQAWDPTGDGTFDGLTGADWVKRTADGYYYYTKPVPPGKPTESSLFKSYTVKTNADFSNAHLELDIMVQAIQSEAGAAQAAGV